jgi:peptide/nickel transport system permease protein
MWAYIIRRVVYNIPVYLCIVFLVMALLRVKDPVPSMLGKNATAEQYDSMKKELGLDQPFLMQYGQLLKEIVTLNFERKMWSQRGMTVGEQLASAVVPSLMLTLPALILTSILSICVGLISAFFRGRIVDKTLVILAVLGMSVSFLVYIIFGQYFGAFVLSESLGQPVFSIHGYEPLIQDGQFKPSNWFFYMLLPVLISVIVSMGYDTRFYRAVIVEETGQDYITTARAKGAGRLKIMFVHVLRNAMIPIITRIMITLPFLVTGSILLESFFGIPGMGNVLLQAINNNDFPVIEVFVSVFAGLFILSIVATDVLYAIVDPRVKLQ